MRKARTFRLFLLGIIICVNGMSAPISALELQPTIDNETKLPVSVPLIVTAYRASVTTTVKDKTTYYQLNDVDILELYNKGDTPIDLSSWRIFDANDATREYLFSSEYGGYVEPGHHVAVSSEVPHATYRHTGWSSETATSSVATPGLRFVSNNYRVGKLDIKSYNNVLQKRSYGVDGYNDSYVDALPINTPNVDPIMTSVLFDDGLYAEPQVTDTKLRVVEVYPYAKECKPFDTDLRCRDFVKIYNAGDNPVDLYDYALRTDSSSPERTSTNTHQFAHEIIASHEAVTVATNNSNGPLSLANDGGYTWIETRWGTEPITNSMRSYPSVGTTRQGLAWIEVTPDVWDWTMSVVESGLSPYTPIAAAEPIECPAGKYRNPETGRCRTIEEAIGVLSSCDEGYERNPLTNRCRKIASSASASLVPCGEGQERNPTTNRCRSIASAVAELLPCDEGYERNPATNRCRKTLSSAVPKAAYPVLPYAQSPQQSLMNYIIGGSIGTLVLGYAIWEWRQEIGRALRRIVTYVRR